MASPKIYAERAKIFKPFDALNGFREALAEKELIIVEKNELSEDQCYELNWKIHTLKSGDMISVICYERNNYIEKTGIVVRVDLAARTLTLTKKEIPLDDICEINLLERNIFA